MPAKIFGRAQTLPRRLGIRTDLVRRHRIAQPCDRLPHPDDVWMLLRIALSGFHKKGLETGELLTRHLDGPRRIDGVKTLFEGVAPDGAGSEPQRRSVRPASSRSSAPTHDNQARAHEAESTPAQSDETETRFGGFLSPAFGGDSLLPLVARSRRAICR